MSEALERIDDSAEQIQQIEYAYPRPVTFVKTKVCAVNRRRPSSMARN